MSSSSLMWGYSLTIQNELCLAIKQILVNADQYTSEPPSVDAFDMDTVRQEFRVNGHVPNDPDDTKENRKTSASHTPTAFELSASDYAALLNDATAAVVPSTKVVGHKTFKPDRRPLRTSKPNVASTSGISHCVFCQNNQQPTAVYQSHVLRDEFGRTQCPLLRIYTCPRCGANGDNAHTLRYCTKKRIITMEDALSGGKGFKFRRGVRM